MRYHQIINEAMTVTLKGLEAWRNTTGLEHGQDDDFADDIANSGGALSFIINCNQWINSLPETLTLYRGLHLPDPQAWIKNHTREVGRNLGVSWTDQFEVAINENGPDGGFSRQENMAASPTNIVLVANVPKTAVDWYATCAVRTIDAEEPEVRLIKGANIHLVEVALLDTAVYGDDEARPYGKHHVTRLVGMDLHLQA